MNCLTCAKCNVCAAWRSLSENLGAFGYQFAPHCTMPGEEALADRPPLLESLGAALAENCREYLSASDAAYALRLKGGAL